MKRCFNKGTIVQKYVSLFSRKVLMETLTLSFVVNTAKEIVSTPYDTKTNKLAKNDSVH